MKRETLLNDSNSMIRCEKIIKRFFLFRVIDDEPEESDAEIALVVVKDGERVSLGTISDYFQG